MQSFSVIYEKAAARKGGAEALEALLPKPKSAAQLKRVTDDRYLAEMTKCVFRSGFVWQIIEHKWPGFEAAFDRFDTAACAMLSDEDLERLGADERIVRHGKKIASVRGNAQFVREMKSGARWVRRISRGVAGRRRRRSVGRVEAARSASGWQHRTVFPALHGQRYVHVVGRRGDGAGSPEGRSTKHPAAKKRWPLCRPRSMNGGSKAAVAARRFPACSRIRWVDDDRGYEIRH